MSIESRCTIGAIASKKASASAPVASAIPAASAAPVSGPVAMIAGPSGSASTRSRTTSMLGCASSAAVTAAEKPSRSTASAEPAGTRVASAVCRISEPSVRISWCNSPIAFDVASSERRLLEQTSSARLSP